MSEITETDEKRKRKIAFEIIYYFKRLVICAVFFVVYYLVIYNKYVVDYIYNYPIYQKNWLLGEYIEYQDFLLLLFNSFFIIIVILTLFHRQIASGYFWLKKYSKQN